jgi:F-type H+-transporting ATPase subunit O
MEHRGYLCEILLTDNYRAENPTLSASDRESQLSSIVPSGSSPILKNLLSVLSENGRLNQAPKVFEDFQTLIAAYRGELEVVVTSAEPLDSKALSRLEKALKGTEAAAGKTLKLTNRVGDG